MLHLKGQVRSVQPKEVGPSVVRAYIFFFFPEKLAVRDFI